jgi:hypothetical protein
VIDRARDRCQAAEQEILALIKDLEDKAPIDQDREDFYDQCKAAADRSAGAIKEKLAAADKQRDELNDFYRKLVDFRPDANEWKPIATAAQASGLAIVEFYKGALADAHRYCDEMTRADNNPAIAKALRGDCSESTYKGLLATKLSLCSRDRACKGDQTCDEVVARKRLNVECYDARTNIMHTCFNGGDHKHYQALVVDAERSIAKCDEYISKRCK